MLFGLIKRRDWGKRGIIIPSSDLAALFAPWEPEYLHLRDYSVQGISREDFERVMFDARPRGDMIPYRKDLYDCDNFAVGACADLAREWQGLRGVTVPLACGYCEAFTPAGTLHAFLWQIDDKRRVNFYEPQRDERLSWTPKTLRVVESI